MPKIIVNEFYRGGTLTTGDEFIELLLTEDLTAAQLESFFVGDSTGAKASKFSAYDFTNVSSIAATFQAGTIIAVGGTTRFAQDTSYNPTGGDWNIFLNAGGSFLPSVGAGGGDIAGDDIVWVDTASTGATISADGYAVEIGTGAGAFVAAANVNFGASTNNTGYALNSDLAGATNTANWTTNIPSASTTPGQANGGANTTYINSLRTIIPPTGPVVTIAATDATAAEAGTDPGIFRITRTGSTTAALTVTYTIVTGVGQATNGTDYNPTLTGTAVIGIGQSFADITITPVDDADAEGPENVTLTVVDTADYDLGAAASATVAIADNDAITKISAIQGSGTTFNSTFGGTQTIEGIVVAAFPGTSQLRGFYVQEEDADSDGNPATSEGIFVFDPSGLFSGLVGTKVQVTGTVSEFTSSSSNIVSSSNTSSLTEITASSVSPLGTVATLPTATNIVLPVADQPALERYEGMLVNISSASGPLTVTETFKLGRFGQVGLSGGARLDQYTQTNAPSVSGYSNYLANLQDDYIILDDGSSTQNPDPEIFARGGLPLSATNTLRGGDTVASVTGVLDERFEGYRVQTRTPVNFQPTNARETTPPAVGGTIKVGSFNVLNYFTDLDTNPGSNNGPTVTIPNGVSFEPRGANTSTEFTRQRDKIISAITTLNTDVLGIIEIENDGSTSIQNLVNGLNAVAGAGTYAFINDTALVNDPNPAINAVGTDAIKVGFIYKPGSVTPVGAPLSYLEPNPANPIFSRPPVAQTFVDANGGKFTAIVNHFKSKSSADSLPGDTDQGDGQGLSNATRVAQSQALLSFINTVKATSGDDDVLVIGDLNAYAQEDPITTLTNGGLTNLFPDSSYSYQFNGQWGSLDHALASSTLNSQVTGAAKWLINSDEPVVLDYNTDFKSAGQISSFYSSDPFRSSDHDPLVVGLNLSPSLNLVNGTSGRDTLTGTSGSDQITGFQGGDTITTGTGSDRIVYTSIRDSGDIITDFTVGSDKIVLTQLLDSLVSGGYSGTNAIADNYISFVSSGSNTILQLDQDGFGTASVPRSFLTLNNVLVGAINTASNFIF